MRLCDNLKNLAHVCTRRGLKSGSSLKPRKMQVKCYRSVRHAPSVSNLPLGRSGSRARPSVRPSVQRVHKGTGQCERPGQAAICRGRSARRGGGWGGWVLVAAGCAGWKAPGAASLSAQPCPWEASHIQPSFNLWIGKSDAEGQGPVGPAGRGRPRALMAQPQSFGSEWRLSEGGGGGGRLF